MSHAPDITQLLLKARHGDAAAADFLYKALYAELTRLSSQHLHRAGTTSLDPCRVVHETYLRLQPSDDKDFVNRKTFFAYASQVMRSVVIDYFRERQADKRGGGALPITLDTQMLNQSGKVHDFLRLNDALIELEAASPRCLQVVEMRYFGGLTEEEIAQLLDVSVPTVKRDWRKARAFLFDQLSN